MAHKLELQHIGPLSHCTIEVRPFTVLTGPQSHGKSTLAKAVYFFRTVKQDILDIMMQGGPKVTLGYKDANWVSALKQRMRNKFLQLFGTSWVMPDDMEMLYIYTEKVSIRVYLKSDLDLPGKNYIEFEYSSALLDYLRDLEEHVFTDLAAGQKQHEETALARLQGDPYETVFIPAGRNLITLLSTQLNYIFTSLEEPQLRNIDYITRRYTELILKLKLSFTDEMDGMIPKERTDPEAYKRYKKHQAAINLLLDMASKVLGARYRCVDGEERLHMNENKYIKVNFASSGQQEIVWNFNLLFYYLLHDKKVFLILEEPESHLYPASQQAMAELLALFCNEGNAGLVTTHSPYVLGTFNYLLLAAQAPKEEEIKKRLRKRYWLDPATTAAYFVHDGGLQQALDTADDLTLIDNGLIDGASTEINEMADLVLSQWNTAEEEDG